MSIKTPDLIKLILSTAVVSSLVQSQPPVLVPQGFFAVKKSRRLLGGTGVIRKKTLICLSLKTKFITPAPVRPT
jgi:hypothetical protein